MGSNVNYVLVGLFVAIFGAGVVGFGWWLAGHSGDQQYDEYLVYMDESVAGLSVDAAVKYRGVNVGTVAAIDLDPKNPERVRLRLKVRRGTPVKTDTTATLRFYGVTGLAYIELMGQRSDAPRLRPGPDGSPPVIPASPSTMTRLDDALSGLASRAQQVLDRLDRLLSDENLANFSGLLQDTRDMVHGVHEVAASIKAQFAAFGRLVDKGIAMEEQVSRSFLDVSRASDQVERLSQALEKTYVTLGEQADRLVERSGRLFEALAADLDRLLESAGETIEELHRDPRGFFFSTQSPQPGPGETPP